MEEPNATDVSLYAALCDQGLMLVE